MVEEGNKKIKSTMLRYCSLSSSLRYLAPAKVLSNPPQPAYIRMIMMTFTDSNPLIFLFFQEQLQKSKDFQKEGLQKTFLFKGGRDRSHRNSEYPWSQWAASPLGSDFQKVRMIAGAGMGCGEGPVIFAARKW